MINPMIIFIAKATSKAAVPSAMEILDLLSKEILYGDVVDDILNRFLGVLFNIDCLSV